MIFYHQKNQNYVKNDKMPTNQQGNRLLPSGSLYRVYYTQNGWDQGEVGAQMIDQALSINWKEFKAPSQLIMTCIFVYPDHPCPDQLWHSARCVNYDWHFTYVIIIFNCGQLLSIHKSIMLVPFSALICCIPIQSRSPFPLKSFFLAPIK